MSISRQTIWSQKRKAEGLCSCGDDLRTYASLCDALHGKATERADTPDELTLWIWDKYVGVPVAGQAWGQEYENLLDRIRRMDRSSFTKGLHEGVKQAKEFANTRLIASAPDLLEALERMLVSFAGQDETLCMECGEGIGTGKTCDTCYVIGKAMAAISRAKGEGQ